MVTRQRQCVTDVSCRCSRHHARHLPLCARSRQVGRPADWLAAFSCFARFWGASPRRVSMEAFSLGQLCRQAAKGMCHLHLCAIQAAAGEATQSKPCMHACMQASGARPMRWSPQWPWPSLLPACRQRRWDVICCGSRLFTEKKKRVSRETTFEGTNGK
ncbi:hypothetical protein BC567DRAFT_46441 [Phyllosticta citribraziliensis]